MLRNGSMKTSGKGNRAIARGTKSLMAMALTIAVMFLLSAGAGTPGVIADTTGFRNPAAQAAESGGDGNGYETNAVDAFAQDGAVADDRDSGTNAALSCTDTGKDRHRYYNYGFTIPGGVTVNGIEVRLEVEMDNATGYICIQLSWDAGVTWTAPKQTPNLSGSPAVYTLGAAADTWGRTWSTPDFGNSTFRVRVIDVANGASARFRLDWVGAQAHYTLAPPDSTGPLTSGVAAADAGGGNITLTANVNDSTTGNSSVAAAEYFIDTVGANGSSSAMAASDGAFDSSAEAVTATVNVSALAAGDHTFHVHGRDTPGNWGGTGAVVITITTGGGGAVQATITLVAGTLSLDAYPVAFPAVTLNGLNQTVDGQPPAWRAIDGRGTGAGWNVTVTSSDFTSVGGTIPVGNFRIRLLDSSVVIVSGGAPPLAQVTTYQALSIALPLKILSAVVSTGMGTYNFTPDFRLVVPASTVPGSYQASIVVSVNSGP
jgi:hypothetical protein